jgi:hypothetical protein
MASDNVITFTNASILAWLDEHGIKGKHMPYIRPMDIVHRNVFGHIPYWLAVYAASVNEVSVPRLDREDRELMRRGEITTQAMDAAGAYIATYKVQPGV